MRDYNSIQFRSPKEKQPPSGALDNYNKGLTKKQESYNDKSSPKEGSTSTVLTSASLSVENSPQSSSTRQNQSINQQQSALQDQPQLHSSPDSKPSTDHGNAMRRDDAEATISRLRNALDEVTSQDALAKNSLAKSDAIILELRSSVRQLKRQLEKIQLEKDEAERGKEETLSKLRHLEQEKYVDNDNQTRTSTDSHARDARIGELQVQLDRAHAQILTADMVRKELEDTLEAEQYTWELRVQEQERSIREWQDQCRSFQADLQQCRSQWKDAEEGWTKELQDLQQRLEKAQQETAHWKSMQTGGSSNSNGTIEMKEKLLLLEQERSELQSCLDDALKELEAVDAELQNDNTIQLREENERLQKLIESRQRDEYQSLVEPLQHLYRWLLERNEGNEHDQKAKGPQSIHGIPNDPRDILSAIRAHLESMPADSSDLLDTRKQVIALESQLSVYRGDLKAREESSAELMASLKEAVALLKPLQDAASKADRERNKLLDQLEKSQANVHANYEEIKRLKRLVNLKDDEIEELRQKTETIELELSKAKLVAANTIISQSRNVAPSPESLNKTRDEVRSKRQSEVALKDLLRDAQIRLNSLHEQNQQVEAMNSELQGRLRQTEESLEMKDGSIRHSNEGSLLVSQLEVEQRDARIKDLEAELVRSQNDIESKQMQIRELEQELNGAKENVRSISIGESGKSLDVQKRVRVLESDLAKSKHSLHKKKEAEKTLKRSLKEALGLLRPLQMHLEESEAEKKELVVELSALKQKVGCEDPVVSFISDNKQGSDLQRMRELEKAVKLLEHENSQLHDALDEVSQSLNISHFSAAATPQMPRISESKLREDIVELKSRYEVTQERLEGSLERNHSLEAAVQKSVTEGQAMTKELHELREKLLYTEGQLHNAKYIATTALVKVEELRGGKDGELSMNTGFDHNRLYEEKAREVDREMNVKRN